MDAIRSRTVHEHRNGGRNLVCIIPYEELVKTFHLLFVLSTDNPIGHAAHHMVVIAIWKHHVARKVSWQRVDRIVASVHNNSAELPTVNL